MKKELQKIVEFTKRECVTGQFKPILQDHMGGTGTFLSYMDMDDNGVFINYEIPFDEIESVEYRYCDRVGNRIERGYFNSIDELKKWIEEKRKVNQMEYSDFYMRVPSTYFPFYECDKIGSAYITITTKSEEISIYFPSQKITFEKDWNKSGDGNTENEEDGNVKGGSQNDE